jgi:hypothetical protein
MPEKEFKAPRCKRQEKDRRHDSSDNPYHIQRSMKRISVDNIENGMILGRDVCGASGNILVGKGTAISPAMGRRLKNWSIMHVYIEGEEENQQADEGTSVSPSEVRTVLEAKFSRCMSNPIMQKIFAAVYQFRIQKE